MQAFFYPNLTSTPVTRFVDIPKEGMTIRFVSSSLQLQNHPFSNPR